MKNTLFCLTHVLADNVLECLAKVKAEIAMNNCFSNVGNIFRPLPFFQWYTKWKNLLCNITCMMSREEVGRSDLFGWPWGSRTDWQKIWAMYVLVGACSHCQYRYLEMCTKGTGDSLRRSHWRSFLYHWYPIPFHLSVTLIFHYDIA